jgi:hypothetical protein
MGDNVMECKIARSNRLGLLGSAAAVALLSAIPVFVSATPVFANGQHVIQTGTNDSETQVQQAGVTTSYQYVTQSTTNASPVPLQSYQLQKTGTTGNDQYVHQADYNGYAGNNSINQVQASSSNEMGASQHGYNNRAIQYQNGGGSNEAWIGETGNTSSGGQYGAGNYVKQTQLGSDEYAQVWEQYGNYNSATQFQNFVGAGAGEGAYIRQYGSNNTAVQKQYSDASERIEQNGDFSYGNNANQFQAATVATNSYEHIYQDGARNFAVQKQYAGFQQSYITQFGGFGAKGNLAYTFQTGYVGNQANIYQGEHGGSLGGDYNGRAYIDQFGAGTGAVNQAWIYQYSNPGGTTKSTARATIKQGTAASPVYGEYAQINQYAGYGKATGTVGVYTKGTAYNYALAKQLGNVENSRIEQLNAGVSGNVAYTFQSGPGHGYSFAYQGGFSNGGSNTLYRFGSGGVSGNRPFYGSPTGVSYHPNTPSFDQFATNDRAYVDQWNGAGATFNGPGTPNESNTNLAMIYQNTPNSTAVIEQGSKNSGVFGDTAIILQCNGVGFACGSGTGGGGGTFGYSSRGRNAANAGAGNYTTNPTGVYGNDVAKIYQQNNQEYAKIVQRGLNDYMSLTQTGVGNTFTLYQTGVNNHVVQVQH